MKWKSFHHPDWSLPVVRRRVQEEWMDLLQDLAELLRTAGRSHLWQHTYPNLRSYHNSMSRLRKAGLIVKNTETAQLPRLELTDLGKEYLPVYHQPEKLWNTSWNGIWYMLIFDVPEAERHYRDNLRAFLKRMRMGGLQKSVWITPRDIRPEYDDLKRAANLDAVSYLLESRTVLHHEAREIVDTSWNWEWINKLQNRYLSVYRHNLKLLEHIDHDADALLILLKEDSEAYIQCMHLDPLLPNELLPTNYLGIDVHALHKTLRKKVAHQLQKYIV
ncbi:PaaX family transcriptional regulator C-terminal domain-containing protein [Pontiella agarivorans]|uniref:PaaX family transcriptional regulator C-terminal domain-containing protein n=1 Tax=Pontiella agarivorans TaxID=3038953 RepID=A0ABU5MVV0_9BACT|nr:PaaX family transcriptional regulator C-terminal domain-containing protein [Pontiella agarivorans]MDZ8118344.1 PaaX family transcriptional regulator C-terminal domain-containing protein [Pontiella agarivorans]